LQTDKQSNNIKNITSLVEVIKMYADTVQTYIHRHTHTHIISTYSVNWCRRTVLPVQRPGTQSQLEWSDNVTLPIN